MTDSKTATERLRELLDERRVEWRETVNYIGCVFTHYKSAYFDEVSAMDNGDGYLYFDDLNCVSLTPEQAIAATLGSGECENVAKRWGEFECSECGMYADFGSDLHRVSTCPQCAKAVKR